ncbi:hypothetical protein DNTS_026260 [Danionella cerebrum]|uniref:Protein-tyrosine sulfotransferase n=1 Tax=Danionella cerebrum TaxID=2873325 RepID=A0A553RG77_9TELE|nr:hypothetical protein DNTS_026260 [Danionella translucida]
MPVIAPMLARLGYDPHANPPNYGRPDPLVLDNTRRILGKLVAGGHAWWFFRSVSELVYPLRLICSSLLTALFRNLQRSQTPVRRRGPGLHPYNIQMKKSMMDLGLPAMLGPLSVGIPRYKDRPLYIESLGL